MVVQLLGGDCEAGLVPSTAWCSCAVQHGLCGREHLPAGHVSSLLGTQEVGAQQSHAHVVPALGSLPGRCLSLPLTPELAEPSAHFSVPFGTFMALVAPRPRQKPKGCGFGAARSARHRSPGRDPRALPSLSCLLTCQKRDENRFAGAVFRSLCWVLCTTRFGIIFVVEDFSPPFPLFLSFSPTFVIHAQAFCLEQLLQPLPVIS